MSKPITDIEVLRRDFAVPGAEWRTFGPAERPMLCSVENGAGYWEIRFLSTTNSVVTFGDGRPPLDAQLAVHCAALGQPTPRALAREVEVALRPIRFSDHAIEPITQLLARLASIGGES